MAKLLVLKNFSSKIRQLIFQSFCGAMTIGLEVKELTGVREVSCSHVEKARNSEICIDENDHVTRDVKSVSVDVKCDGVLGGGKNQTL